VSGLYIVEGNAGHKEFSCCVILWTKSYRSGLFTHTRYPPISATDGSFFKPLNIQVRHRNGRLLEPFFPGNIRPRLEECLSKGGGHLEDVVFKK